jgi:predicted ATPase
MHEPILKELRLTNILSFGPETESIPLGPLNVLIGPNGSGKSNLIEVISLLRAAPKDLSAPVKEAGGVRDWLWKGAKNPTATIEAIVANPNHPEMPTRHIFSFVEHGMRFEVTAERIENQNPFPTYREPLFYYRNENGYVKLKDRPNQQAQQTRIVSESGVGAGGEESEERQLPRDKIDPERSVLSQVRDPERYPMLAYLTEMYGSFRLYREWTFGRYTSPRQMQKADLPTDYLMENCENLALVLNALRPRVKQDIIEALGTLYPEIDDFNVQIQGGWVQLYLEEGPFSIPATRLSDGTLRYLCLIAILCHPNPPPLVCIEEPELGLHPDVLPYLADLMISASKRCQLIVTTHSDMLVDALSDTPESVIVCEKRDGKTRMQRLNRDDLKEWLENYRLGDLWLKGEIGGTRW